MAKRGVLPEEKQVDEGVVRGLQPRLEHRHTVDVVRFQDERHWGSVLRGGDLAHALSVIRDIMMHEMREGYAVSLPGIGTFRPLLLQECLPALHFASYGDRGRHIRFDVYIQLFNSSDTVRQRHASPLAHTNPWKPRKQNPKR